MRGSREDRTEDTTLAATGVAGLDDILRGGFPRGHVYLLQGPPGAGKTTLALQFLLTGHGLGERGVYVTLSETEGELRSVARSHGWSLDPIPICDLQSSEQSLQADSQYTLFHPAEVELSETTETVLEQMERIQPERAVFDSLSEMRLLARDSLRYRRQVLALKHYFARRGTTVLLLDTDTDGEYQLATVAHGVVELEQLTPEYGAQRRRLRIQKIRGLPYREGYHDFTITTGGLEVYPRLIASEHPPLDDVGPPEQVSSGLPRLDELLGGGLERGTSALFLGPSGVGKSTVAMQYMTAALRRGERGAAFLFDEGVDAWLMRADRLGFGLRRSIDDGELLVVQINTAELSPGAFASRIRGAVESFGARVVIIDSLNGFLASMPQERFLTLHIHELLAYLNQKRLLTLMTLVQHGILGDTVRPSIELSYVADTVLLMRFFEAFGEVRQAISVVKKRVGAHARLIRELRIEQGGVAVGEELRAFGRVLTGHPDYRGARPELLGQEHG